MSLNSQPLTRHREICRKVFLQETKLRHGRWARTFEDPQFPQIVVKIWSMVQRDTLVVERCLDGEERQLRAAPLQHHLAVLLSRRYKDLKSICRCSVKAPTGSSEIGTLTRS